MSLSKQIVRRLLLEQLAERVVFHAEEIAQAEEPLFTPDGFAYFYGPTC